MRSVPSWRRILITLIISAPTPLACAQYQNQTEYEMASRAYREREPGRKLNLLQNWARSFPRSQFRQDRFNEMIVTEQKLGRGDAMWKTAAQMVADDANGAGNYWLTVLTVALQNSTPEGLGAGRRAAATLLRNLPKSFAIEQKPASVDQDAWYREKDRQSVLAKRTLGWIALQERDWAEAERVLMEVLQSTPQDAEVSYWLGVALLGTRDPAREANALFHFARSLAVTGDGALTPAARQLVQPYFESAYGQMYGGREGIPALMQTASASPFPPAPAR